MKENKRLETNRMEKNYRLERKLTRWYGSSIRTRLWAVKICSQLMNLKDLQRWLNIVIIDIGVNKYERIFKRYN